jgi:hypothetical protein
MTRAQELSQMALKLEGVKTRKITEKEEQPLLGADGKPLDLRTDVFPQYGLQNYTILDKKGKKKDKASLTHGVFRLSVGGYTGSCLRANSPRTGGGP